MSPPPPPPPQHTALVCTKKQEFGSQEQILSFQSGVQESKQEVTKVIPLGKIAKK